MFRVLCPSSVDAGRNEPINISHGFSILADFFMTFPVDEQRSFSPETGDYVRNRYD